MKRYGSSFIGIVFSLFLFSAPAFALSLDEAKAQGLIGEKQNGYIGAVQPGASGEVNAVVNDVNQKRTEKYFEIAKKNGTELAAVEALAGKKALEATPPGQFIQGPSGQWMKK